MAKELTQRSLRLQFTIATLLMTIFVVGSFVCAFMFTSAQQTATNYASAVEELGVSMRRLELELLVDQTRPSEQDLIFDSDSVLLKSIKLYSALRANDPDGVDEDSDSAESSEILEEILKNDLSYASTQQEYGFSGRPMPAAFAALWEMDEDAVGAAENENIERGDSLEERVGQALELAASIFSEETSVDERRARVQEYTTLMKSTIDPQFAETTEIIKQLIKGGQSQNLIVHGAIVVSGLLVIGFIALGLFRPLHGRIGDDRAKIIASLQKAETADRAKTEFLTNMSHEIRTPMNGVMGMTELLMLSELSSKQRGFAEIILKSSESLLTIINDILDFSKIDSGQLQLARDPFDMRTVIEDVTGLVLSAADKKSLEVIVRYHPDSPRRFIGDAGRVRQIVMNLVGNAIKFTDSGHVLIDVSAAVEGDEAQLSLRVEDTGIGIPAEKLEFIFDKFNQVDNSTKRNFDGTGLGLAICRMLTEKMGGDIGVESEFGKGACFSVKIPLPLDAAAQRPPARVSEVCGLRALVVDDNEVIRAILREQLESWKMTPTLCASAREAVAALDEAKSAGAPIEIVIMDLNMPLINGADAVKRICVDDNGFDMPIIMLTSATRERDEDGLQRLGVQACLTKPARASRLLDTIISVMSEAKLGQLQEIASDGKAQSIIDNGVVQRDAQPTADGIGKILVVEDNLVNQAVVAAFLEMLGYGYKLAEDGKIAVDISKEYSPDLILMDIAMPVMDGFEATAEIRRLDEIAKTRTVIVGLTAKALVGDREKCLEAGMDDYIAKPVKIEQLRACLEKWVVSSKASRAG